MRLSLPVQQLVALRGHFSRNYIMRRPCNVIDAHADAGAWIAFRALTQSLLFTPYQSWPRDTLVAVMVKSRRSCFGPESHVQLSPPRKAETRLAIRNLPVLAHLDQPLQNIYMCINAYRQSGAPEISPATTCRREILTVAILAVSSRRQSKTQYTHLDITWLYRGPLIRTMVPVETLWLSTILSIRMCVETLL